MIRIAAVVGRELAFDRGVLQRVERLLAAALLWLPTSNQLWVAGSSRSFCWCSHSKGASLKTPSARSMPVAGSKSAWVTGDAVIGVRSSRVFAA